MARTPKPAGAAAAEDHAQPVNDSPAPEELLDVHKKHHKASSGQVAAAEPSQPPSEAAAEQQQAKKLQKKSKNNKLLSEEKIRRLKEQHGKRGIIYISRLPPHMKPGKLRQLLSQYGEIGRIYCTPEDTAARKQRKKKGGNSGKNFTEGWVEFEDKAVAKSVAAALNGQQIGGKRRSAYHFDLWCMRYLPKFKWDHLTEEITYEKAVREQRMAQELAAAKRERDFYLSRVDKAKALAAMEQRRSAKQQQQQQQGSEAAVDTAAAAADMQQQKQKQLQPGSNEGAIATAAAGDGKAAAAAAAAGVKRMYGQRKVKADPAQPGAAEIGEDVLGMLVAPKKQRVS